MGDFVDILVLILVSVAGLVQGLISERNKKKKKAQAEQASAQSSSVEVIFDDIPFERPELIAMERGIITNPPVIKNEMQTPGESIDKPAVTQIQPKQEMRSKIPVVDIHDDTLKEDAAPMNPLLEDFDLKKAVLYAEILKPKF